MISLPQALQGLLPWPQFILCDINGVPVNPEGYPVDAHTPDNWMPAAEALSIASITGLNISFVFTEQDPFFCVDLDHCYVDGAWSDTAREVCRRLAGCAVEVSKSGDGLHIIGQYRGEISHKTRSPGMELYTRKRAIRLTGTHASGSVAYDADGPLRHFIDQYFPLDECDADPSEWTAAPCDGWAGFTDDGELVARALKAVSSSSAFGGVTFADLWNCNSERLGSRWPSVSGADFDHSSADAALCAHLAFWAGKDCSRIDRVFRGSGLYRGKWDRAEYKRSTILYAVSRCTSVYTRSKPVADPATDAPDGGLNLDPGGIKIMSVTDQPGYFKGCTYVIGAHRVLTPGGHMLRPEQFRAVYGGHLFMMDAVNDKTTKNAWEALTESRALTFPQAHATCFRPELAPGQVVEEEGYKMVNLYSPIETAAAEGDPEPFLAHLAHVLPNTTDRTILLSYMAGCVQYPGKKFQWAPLLQGCEGNGKTIFINCLAHAIGHRYTHLPNAADLGGNGAKFNSWLQNKLFIGIEEINMGDRREVADALKPLITNRRVEIQGKGVDQITGDNRANFFLCSNPKDAVTKGVTDRRYCVFYTAQQTPDDMAALGWIDSTGHPGKYFRDLYDWLQGGGYEIVNWYLRQYDIPDRYNPATDCHRAPLTSSTSEAVSRGLNPIEQEILAAAAEGRAGFAGGWISSVALDRLLTTLGAARLIPRSRRRDILKGIGYHVHPGIPGGRLTKSTLLDGGKPTLYVLKGHIMEGLEGGADIKKAYERAQEG